jgi:hypothetical protein
VNYFSTLFGLPDGEGTAIHFVVPLSLVGSSLGELRDGFKHCNLGLFVTGVSFLTLASDNTTKVINITTP